MSRRVVVKVDCPSVRAKVMRGTSDEGRKKEGEQWRRCREEEEVLEEQAVELIKAWAGTSRPKVRCAVRRAGMTVRERWHRV